MNIMQWRQYPHSLPENDSIENVVNLEDVKAYWDERPCNVRHSKSPIGTVEYFNEVEQRKYFVEPHIPLFANFDQWRGLRVLEIGCGIGTDAVNFARAGAVYTGIELSKNSLDLTKKRFEVFNLPGRLLEGDVESLHEVIRNEKFDFVYSFGVLHHTPSLSAALNEIANLMHENSIFKMMVYSKHSWKNAMIEAGLDQPEAQYGCPIANTYSKSEIILELEKVDLTCVEIKQDHIFPYVIERYKNYEYEVQPWFRAMPREMFRALETALGWHLLVEARKNSTSAKVGEK